MAEKSGKNTSKKPADASVLGSLPSTRPTRIGGERRATARRNAGATTASATETAGARTTRGKGGATRTTTAPRKPRSKVAATRPAVPGTKTAQPAAGRRVPPPPEPERRRAPGPPRGTELVTTAVQAAGELAQIGLTVGSRVLRRAANRLPRP